MKAWQVYDWANDMSTIIFAETKGKAKSIAMRCGLFAEDTNFIEFNCYRRKHGDQFYNGKSYLDWDCDDDRLLMVKEFGFTCREEWYTERECYCCVAKKYCSLYEWLKEREETL